MKIKFRYSLYALVMTSLHLFSQILLNNIASHYFNAYITAAINGIITIESYYWIRSLQGQTFFKVFWAIYGVRVMMLFFYIVIKIALSERQVGYEFVGTFFTYYFIWLILEIIILVIFYIFIYFMDGFKVLAYVIPSAKKQKC